MTALQLLALRKAIAPFQVAADREAKAATNMNDYDFPAGLRRTLWDVEKMIEKGLKERGPKEEGRAA